MGMIDEWGALAARIRALGDAAQLQATFLGIYKNDAHNVTYTLSGQASSVLADTITFSGTYDSLLPPLARAAVGRLRAIVTPLTSNAPTNRDSSLQQMWAAVLLLASFESEMSYLLSDTQEGLRLRSERAFAHLQRSIIADSDCRRKWEAAFTDGEPACERMGSVHLLLHGIWAFKVSAEGGQTDLVFQEPTMNMGSPDRYAEGLVLTEWKRAKSDSDSAAAFVRARNQAQRYQKRLLGGTELTAYRFAVVVSRDYVKEPDSIEVDGTTYLHKNIAVSPSSPSKSSA